MRSSESSLQAAHFSEQTKSPTLKESVEVTEYEKQD